jgi:DNA-directed RNA polymerase subunit RPC12/RpoP/Zn ribbon nucleic-acid-binding protein
MSTDEGERAGIATLEAAVASLLRRVEALEAEVAATRGRREASMRTDARCPACGARKILHAREVLDRSESGRSRLALAQPSIWRERGVGEFEVYVCVACGLCEWRVKDLLGLEIDNERFRLLEIEEPKPGPYR